jgi:hypothetical protein
MIILLYITSIRSNKQNHGEIIQLNNRQSRYLFYSIAKLKSQSRPDVY